MTLKEFGAFCNGRACDDCENGVSDYEEFEDNEV